MKIRNLILVCALLLSSAISAQILTFKVQTVTYGGTYSPRHVMAIWITDSNGKFVKTVDRHANVRIQYLTNWISSSTKNVVDATTGATLTSHPSTPVTYTWNCTNVSKIVVPDGSYKINVEFTEIDGTGKIATYPFEIGPASQNTFTDLTNFKNVSYSITQSAQTAINLQKASLKYEVAYVRSQKMVQVKYDTQMHEKVSVSVSDLNGKSIIQRSINNGNTQIDASVLPKGSYVIKLIDNKGYSEVKKVVVR